jgi:hypothetical protein
MSYAISTLTDLHQMLADKISAGVVPTSSVKLAYWTRMLNDGQQYCADRLRLTTSTSLTTTGATSTTSGTIALPDNFVMIEKVIDSNGTQLQQINKEDSANIELVDAFWITGTHSNWVLNTPTNDTYTVWYVYRLAPMVNTTDECLIPDPLAVVCYAYSKLRMAQTDPLQDADKELGESNRRCDEIVSAYIFNETGGLKWTLDPNA